MVDSPVVSTVIGCGDRASDTTMRELPQDIRKVGIDPEFWYPLARTSELRRGETIGTSFAGDPIALVRTDNGKVFALEDRCAHRQVPLHAGVVMGEHIQCSYHGWTYDASGRCINVPYLDKARSLPNGVRTYPCREAYGLIFVFPGHGNRATVALPDLPSCGSPHYRTHYLDRSVACHYSFMHENLMDMNHQFLHRRRAGSVRTTLTGLRRFNDRVEVTYTFADPSGGRLVGEWFMLGYKRVSAAKRARNRMTIATTYPYQTLRYWPAGCAEPALDLWNVYVPLDREQRRNRTFGLMMVRKPPLPGLIHLLWPFIIRFADGIFTEDQWIVEQEQKAFDRQGQDENQEVSPAILALRALLVKRGIPLRQPCGAGIR
jgi:renierapurpurin 18,18'-hydroxylase